MKIVYCINCKGTGSIKTIDDCEMCNGVGTYRIVSKSILDKYNLGKLPGPDNKKIMKKVRFGDKEEQH
jgi:RecJ-like exonuclease